MKIRSPKSWWMVFEKNTHHIFITSLDTSSLDATAFDMLDAPWFKVQDSPYIFLVVKPSLPSRRSKRLDLKQLTNSLYATRGGPATWTMNAATPGRKDGNPLLHSVL